MLDWAYEVVLPYGTPIAIVAWVTVLGGVVALVFPLRRYELRPFLLPAAAVGGASLLAHLLDYWVTLRISPDLGLEANPLWRVVVELWGAGPAKLYGLSGKILLSILAFELFAFYLAQRSLLFPRNAAGPVEFWRRFGNRSLRVDWRRIANFFSFTFAWIGPFYFYVALMNSLAEGPHHERLPAMPLVLVAYLGATTGAYLLFTYRAFCRLSEA